MKDQGCIALENSFNRVGLAPRSVSESGFHRRGRRNAGLTREECSTPFRWRGWTVSRCAPIAMRRTPARVNPGGGQCRLSRAVRLALMAKTGEMGYPSALTAPVCGLLRRLF
ncbi:hypothetical protein ACLK11_01870 [Escherichia coli]